MRAFQRGSTILAQDLQERRHNLERDVEIFERAVATDSTATVTANRRLEIVNATSSLLKATANEFENTRRVIADARATGDAIVKKGAAGYD